MFKWVGKLSKAGLRDAASLVNAKQVNETRQEMQERAQTILNPFNQRAGREETFQNAYSRLGLDESTLAQVYLSHRLRFYISLVFLMGALGLTVVGFFSSHWWVGFPSLAAVAVCLAQMFNSSLRTYQINHRDLVGITEWWNASKEWWPGPFVTLDEFQKKAARAERRAARRAARKGGTRDLAVVERNDRS